MSMRLRLSKSKPSHPAAARSRRLRRPLAILAAALTASPLLAVATPVTAEAATVRLFSGEKPQTAKNYKKAITVGLEFTSSADGEITGMRFYKATKGESGKHRASLWTSTGQKLASRTFKAKKATGWQDVTFKKPIAISANTTYVLSYYAPHGQYAKTTNGLTQPVIKGELNALGSVYRYGKGFPVKASKANFWVDVAFKSTGTASLAKPTGKATSPAPAPTATTAPAAGTVGGWPNAANTGVPSGTSLTPYTGPCTITAANTVIDAKTVNCVLTIQAANVTITRSRINGGVDLRSASSGASFTITDSEVHIGDNLNTGLMRANFRATRVEITGGRRSVYCETNCVIQDSWVHDQGGDPGGDAHFSGIRMSQNTTIRHNTITCEALRGPGTGCSAGLTGYGDFAPVQNNLIENNRFIGGNSTFCAYGGSSPNKPYSSGTRDIRFVNNVFVRGTTGRCGNLGAVASFNASAPRNVWSGNTWDDGATMTP
ncbi:MAG TPA: DUF4082 domain-containing protein [Actinomycetota bacterium]|nr:DUF4082 domain-containing protein [Actinomycetota bacterium]